MGAGGGGGGHIFPPWKVGFERFAVPSLPPLTPCVWVCRWQGHATLNFQGCKSAGVTHPVCFQVIARHATLNFQGCKSAGVTHPVCFQVIARHATLNFQGCKSAGVAHPVCFQVIARPPQFVAASVATVASSLTVKLRQRSAIAAI